MAKESIRKQILIKSIKKDLELALLAPKDISKAELLKILHYFTIKAESLS
ncbi:hypothetical protein [Aliivibrio salmonicida]